LPCLATLTHRLRRRRRTVVEMLKVIGAIATGANHIQNRLPVEIDVVAIEIEHRTDADRRGPVAHYLCCPVISATVSPFIRRAVMNAPIWTASPRRP